ncbi:MAG: DUF1080 domain-containing protein [Planctomycetes bacterium]|nr:DUF1080 domain-containing protein [Planctomycetota bacterium]
MPTADPSLSVAERVDAACDSFERDWRAGRNPRIDDYLAAVPESDRDALRAALLAVEAELNTERAAETSAGQDSIRTGSHHGPAMTVAHPASELGIPQRIGRFEVRAVLGSGAFGRVYRAFDPSLDRDVALKVPLAESLQTAAARDRFLKEARAAATVSHPNICQIHEVGEHDGQPYIVMAFVPGQSLAEMLRNRTELLPEKQAAIIVRKLALALDVAHKKGVVHRDLKPANVMFDKDRKDLVVMDFGLARRSVSGDVRDTQSGVVMGTPAYMSPEQARGDAKDVGPAADIFSLGIIMYELLTGSRPFSGTAQEVIGRILLVEPEPPSQRRAGISPLLETICLKAMAKDPAARFASMKEFAAAVEGYLRQPTTGSAETVRAAKTKRNDESDSDEGLSTNTRKLADVFEAISEQQETAKAETAAAIEAAAGRHRTPRWIFAALALLIVSGLTAVSAVVFFTKTDAVKVTIELTDIDLADKTLSFFLDEQPITAEQLAKPIELKPGEHVLVVKRGKVIVKRVLLTVKGGRTPGIKLRDITPPEAEPEPDPKTPIGPVVNPKKPKDPVVDPKVPDVEAGFVSIFNGKNLDGWEVGAKVTAFSVDADGTLLAAGDTLGSPRWLLTNKQYSDYVLRLEFQIIKGPPTHTNSGVAIRALPGLEGPNGTKLEVQLRTDRTPPLLNGAVVFASDNSLESADPPATKSAGEWNTLEIEVRGSRVLVTLNGKPANDADLSKIDRTKLAPKEKGWIEAALDRKAGHIGLQSYRGPIKFRNIRVKDLVGGVPPDPKADGFTGLELVQALPHNALVYDATFSPDGTKVFTTCAGVAWEGAGLQTWDARTGKREGTLVKMIAPKLVWGADRLLIGAAHFDPKANIGQDDIVVWNATKWASESRFSFDGDTQGRFNSLEALPGGKLVLAARTFPIRDRGDQHTTAIFDLATGERKLKVTGQAAGVVPRAGGTATTILVADGNDLKEIEIATEKVVRTLKGHTEFVQCLVVSRDGRFAASSGKGTANELYLWDLGADDGAPVLLGKHKVHLYCLAFAPNGKSLLSGSSEGVLKLWSVAERREVTAIRTDPVCVNSIAYAADGRHAVTAGSDGHAKVWKLTK